MKERSFLIWALTAVCANGFVPSAPYHEVSSVRSQPMIRRPQHQRRHVAQTAPLHMQQYDISKPVFDLYALRSVRGDALTKYNSLNQSEPLRINLYALGVLVFLSLPALSNDVNGVPLTLPQAGVSILGAVGSTFFFIRECQKRSRQLTRIEKELVARDLRLRPPASVLADRPFGDALSIRSLQEYGGGPRVLALYSATAGEMKKVLASLRVFGKRLTQANVLVIAIVRQGNLDADRCTWLATPGNPKDWIDYFDSLSVDDTNDKSPLQTFKWFGLSNTGRSFGSGAGEPPSWLQLFGQHLRPLDIIDPEDTPLDDSSVASSTTVQAVLGQQQVFYDALTNGKLAQLESVFLRNETQQVTNVMNEGGRLDSWKYCLEDGSRPEGMKIGNADVVMETETRAFSTCIEYPVADGLVDARLLAVQEWMREDTSSDWKIVQHQTIPWTTDVAAAGTLICDCRGCVSLVRGNQRRTFGGLIG